MQVVRCCPKLNATGAPLISNNLDFSITASCQMSASPLLYISNEAFSVDTRRPHCMLVFLAVFLCLLAAPQLWDSKSVIAVPFKQSLYGDYPLHQFTRGSLIALLFTFMVQHCISLDERSTC